MRISKLIPEIYDFFINFSETWCLKILNMKKLQRKIFIFLLKSSESSVIYENLEIGFREQNFGRQEVIFFKNFDVTYFNKNERKNELKGENRSRFSEFPTNSILRPMVFTQTTRQRGY